MSNTGKDDPAPRRRRKKKQTDGSQITAMVLARPPITLPRTKDKRWTRNRAGVPVPKGTRQIFLKAYEDCFGNVSTACKVAQIHRRTFYRWLESPTPVNVKFRKQLSLLRANERLVDAAEYTITEGLAKGDITAAIFTLKTKGRHRGWSERPETLAAMGDLLDRVAGAYRAWLEDHPEAALEEKTKWLCRFAENGKVPAQDLAKRVGLPLDAE